MFSMDKHGHRTPMSPRLMAFMPLALNLRNKATQSINNQSTVSINGSLETFSMACGSPMTSSDVKTDSKPIIIIIISTLF